MHVASLLSVLIPTLNEEENIKDCIESVADLASEIVVLDSGSEDRTVQMATALGASVKERAFDNFASQKNYGLQSLKNPWILMLDADERVTPELRAEIRTLITNNPSHSAYSIRRIVYFGRKEVRCWSTGRVVRLLRSGAGRFDETRPVHEAILVDGTIGQLQAPILHYTFRSFRQYLAKVELFTRLAAQKSFESGERATWLKLLFQPAARFLKTYLIRGGILDGTEGLMIAWLSAYSAFLKLAKLWDLQKRDRPT